METADDEEPEPIVKTESKTGGGVSGKPRKGMSAPKAGPDGSSTINQLTLQTTYLVPVHFYRTS
jgi:hypothetical protein